MNAKVTASLVLIPILLASASHAAVIERDWLNEGDGLLTFDTINQREWLDVPQTLLSEYPGGLAGVIADLQPGGDLEGFTWGKRDDVFALGESAGIDTETLDLAVNEIATKNLIDLLDGSSEGSRSGAAYGYAGEFLNGNVIDTDSPAVALFFVRVSNSASTGQAGFGFASLRTLSEFILSDQIGLMLYREAVPEPSSWLLAVLGATSFICMRRLVMSTHQYS